MEPMRQPMTPLEYGPDITPPITTQETIEGAHQQAIDQAEAMNESFDNQKKEADLRRAQKSAQTQELAGLPPIDNDSSSIDDKSDDRIPEIRKYIGSVVADENIKTEKIQE